MTVLLGRWPFLVSFCAPVPGVQSTKTNGHYNSFHFHNFHDFPKMAVSWFYAVHQQCLCVWPKLRVQMQRQNESLRRYYSFNLTNVKRKTSFTGLNKNPAWPQWPVGQTRSGFFLFVWPGPKYCSFFKCQPLTNCLVHGANFAQSDRLQCIVQTNWRCSKTKVTWNERTRHSLTNIIFTSFLQYLLIVNSFVNNLVGWQEMSYWHRYSASAYKSIQFRVADKNK